MPSQVIYAAMIEATLMVAAAFFLVQPRFLFQPRSERSRLALTVSGIAFLAMVFCWGVVLGCLVVLNEMTFQI